MDVKTAGRTIDLFEAFATVQRPLSMSELARQLGIPVSSCFGLVRTIEKRGYLYSLKPRSGLYPTKRMLNVARIIAAHDPVGGRASPILSELRDRTGESVVLAKRSGHQVVYLEVFESPHRIRYTAQVGELREMHANSIGKALLGSMSGAEREKVLQALAMPRYTQATLTSRRELEADLERSRERGWYANFGESVSDVMAVALPVTINGDLCGVSLVGPVHRMEPDLDRHIRHLREACAALQDPDDGAGISPDRRDRR